MKKQIELIAMVLALAFLIALLASTIFRTGFPSAISISYTTMAAVGVILRIGCAWWLYQKTKSKQQYPWLWCLLGLVFGLVSIAVYYLIEIYKKVSLLEDKS